MYVAILLGFFFVLFSFFMTFLQTNGNKRGKAEKDSIYSPLPPVLTNAGDHHGTYGRMRYVYIGKHSEGNRFIRNNDL